MDFMFNTLFDGRRYRVINIMDEFNREFIEFELGVSLPSIKFIQPESPTQNSRMERLNGSMRREFFDAYLFDTLSEVKIMAEE
jgi:putative transposase